MPKSPEHIQAINAYLSNPSEATKATMLETGQRDVLRNERHNRQQGLIWLSLFAMVDFIAIYFFWNYGVTKTAA